MSKDALTLRAAFSDSKDIIEGASAAHAQIAGPHQVADSNCHLPRRAVIGGVGVEDAPSRAVLQSKHIEAGYILNMGT